MIITIKGSAVDIFKDSNIGTLSTWTISRVLGDGATYNGVTYVDKNAALNATVTIAEGYELGSAGVTVTMGGSPVTSGITVDGNTITISIASVTGNVVIKVPTKNIATGEEEEPENPVNPPSGGTTSKSLAEIKQSLQMYCAKDTAETSPDSVIAPVGVTENTDSIQITTSSTLDRCYFSNIPLTPGSEVEITITPSSNSNPNYCIGFESDISTSSWASKNWKSDTTGITIPESHLWIMTKEGKNDDNKIAYLERQTGKFTNASPSIVTSALEGTDGRYTLKVLNNGFEAYKNGVKVYTMTSAESNPYLTHTTAPVYFCFATATLLGIKIHSIKVA